MSDAETEVWSLHFASGSAERFAVLVCEDGGARRGDARYVAEPFGDFRYVAEPLAASNPEYDVQRDKPVKSSCENVVFARSAHTCGNSKEDARSCEARAPQWFFSWFKNWPEEED